MPGIERRPASSRLDTACGHVAIVSAAVRYARTLNAFSPLISSRSAICASTCAACLLSTRESVALEGEVENAGAPGGERGPNRVARFGRSIAEETPAAASAADLGR